MLQYINNETWIFDCSVGVSCMLCTTTNNNVDTEHKDLSVMQYTKNSSLRIQPSESRSLLVSLIIYAVMFGGRGLAK